jgi:hypothetical protein
MVDWIRYNKRYRNREARLLVPTLPVTDPAWLANVTFTLAHKRWLQVPSI